MAPPRRIARVVNITLDQETIALPGQTKRLEAPDGRIGVVVARIRRTTGVVVRLVYRTDFGKWYRAGEA